MKFMENEGNQADTDPKVVKNLSSEGEIITFRFQGADPDGRPLHTLRAEHLADVLEGLHELAEDLEDQPGAVDHAALEELLEVALLPG